MKTDHNLSRREERENEQREQAVFDALNRASVGLALVLGAWLMWAFLLGLTN